MPSFSSAAALLSALGCPETHAGREGALTWSNDVGDAAAAQLPGNRTVASLIQSASGIACAVRSAGVNGSRHTHFAAEWATDAAGIPRLVQATWPGGPAPASDEEAVARFVLDTQRLGAPTWEATTETGLSAHRPPRFR